MSANQSFTGPPDLVQDVYAGLAEAPEIIVRIFPAHVEVQCGQGTSLFPNSAEQPDAVVAAVTIHLKLLQQALRARRRQERGVPSTGSWDIDDLADQLEAALSVPPGGAT